MASSRYISVVFRLIFFLMLTMNYVFTVFYIWFPINLHSPLDVTFMLYYHILYIMVFWTIWETAKSDPGQVPLYWGFYIGDPDSKRTRYCLMCNVFKPIRCHHCSMCNRCVLNMDHHCPWINSCIGFYNRKFFMQMVFYINITIISTLIANSTSIYNILYQSFIQKLEINYGLILKGLCIVLYGLDIVMTFIILQFFKFHIKLVLENKTTIETLDHKGQEFHSKYDKGYLENWYEVMGVNKLLWFFPMKHYLGKPKGNGIDWGNDEDALSQNESNIELAQKLNDYNKDGDQSQNKTNTASKIDTGYSPLDNKHQGHASMSSLYQQI